ncbi:endonuclease/exonuclease/phosphatase family protein [Aliiglaciecola lipolytica]|uniref:Endonuclease/exonuclease/phosphatase domain-containing protein n=1 Tax=Aliiglaciecola lipolytica E3 TaxID=1127673 RepID=K6YCD6_9ALTE|nr:endonuclease/exonuclease/phosphatase family protein [Aliiglaciecola lipolytica]GAC15842.1 hypothetical protein GLIP_3225 [Aliiglaciecola lipolytica E3]
MFKKRYNAIEALKIMGNAPKQDLGPHIEVLLWNVFKCKRLGWQDDFERLIHSKDLILLQEAVLNSPFDRYFTQSKQYQWIMARSFKHLPSNIETGVKTGSVVAASKHYFSASEHSEPFTKTKKMLLATAFPLNGQKQSLLVVNSHLINFVSFKKFKAHLDQIFETLENHDGPVLLAGDFNTWNTKRSNYFCAIARTFALEEVVLTRKTRLNHFFRHLDHIYCRGLKVVEAQVHTHIHSSDHFPISLTVSTTVD